MAGNEWQQQGRQATLGLEAGVAEGQTRRSRPGALGYRMAWITGVTDDALAILIER